MKKHKLKMKSEIRMAVQRVFNEYRVNSHKAYNKAIDDVCEELQSMKSQRRIKMELLTLSEHVESIKSRHSKKRSWPWSK